MDTATVQSGLYSNLSTALHCTVYSVQCTVYSVQCTVYSVQYTVYSVQCTVYTWHSGCHSDYTRHSASHSNRCRAAIVVTSSFIANLTVNRTILYSIVCYSLQSTVLCALLLCTLHCTPLLSAVSCTRLYPVPCSLYCPWGKLLPVYNKLAILTEHGH